MLRRCEEAYVLSTRPLGEADLLVCLLTPEQGKVRAVAPSAKRSRRRFGAALEPLTRVRASWVEREGRDLARLESCDIVTSYVLAQRDPVMFYFFAYASEVAESFARENEPDPRFYRLIGAVLDAAAGGIPARGARRYLDLWTLRLQGLLPDLSACASCGKDPAKQEPGGAIMDLAEGALLCGACSSGGLRQGPRLSRKALAAARAALRHAPAEAGGPLGGTGLDGLDEMTGEAMLRFTERPLRTLRFLVEAGG